MQETVGTNILDYFYDANGNPLAVKYRASANATSTYYYYARNSRGDVIGLYNAAGSLYRTYSYDVWGNILSIKDANGNDIASQTDIANLQSLRYRGYYYDSETGFYYLQSRYYDPVTHRFINEDIIVYSTLLGYNQFLYCSNNPIVMVDSNGLMTVKEAQRDLAYNKNSQYTILDITKAQKAGLSLNDDIDDFLLVASSKSNTPPNHPNYKSPKKGDKKVKTDDSNKSGWESDDGSIWVWDQKMHGGPGWVVKYPNGDHDHAYNDGGMRQHFSAESASGVTIVIIVLIGVMTLAPALAV